MASCLAQEIQLAKHYEEVLSRRLVLLKQMESHLRDKDAAEQAWCTQKADAAHKKKCITFKYKSNSEMSWAEKECLGSMIIDRSQLCTANLPWEDSLQDNCLKD